MNKELANAIKGKLLTLPFADMVAGLVQTLTTEEMSADNSVNVVKRRPVSYDVTIVGGDNCAGKEVAVMPDSNRKSIIYFEDFGIATTGTLRRHVGYSSSLRLMCWLDRSKLVGDNYTEIAGRAMSAIVGRLAHKNPENIGIFTRLTIDVARIPPQDPALFGRYTYDETDRQYLRPPFEFFGIDLSCKFYVPEKCLENIPWNISACA
jgi:hypothetical protein